VTDLRSALAELSPDAREAAFWAEDAFLARLHQSKDAWHRVFDLSQHGGIQLNTEKDGVWVRKHLSDPDEPVDHREMMLWVEMNLLRRDEPDYRNFLESLKPFVADAPNLMAIIDDRLKPQEVSAELRRMEDQHQKGIKQAERKEAKAHASWVTFWWEIERKPSAVFAAEVLGCNLCYMGTKFIATRESMAVEDYKAMLVSSQLDDILLSKAFTGLETNTLIPSLVAAGLDPHNLPTDMTKERADALYGRNATSGVKRWRDTWSAGHSVSGVSSIPTVHELIAQTFQEYAAARRETRRLLEDGCPMSTSRTHLNQDEFLT